MHGKLDATSRCPTLILYTGGQNDGLFPSVFAQLKLEKKIPYLD